MIYLDHNATTPMHPEVLEAMLPFLKDGFGNPSSYYRTGREARTALEQARSTIAGYIGARPEEIIFTSGGTESDNLALRGAARALRSKGNHIITSSIEHLAVLNTCRDLEQEGFRVTYLPVDAQGRIDPGAVKQHICQQTILISIMQANNEIGVMQPVEETGALARALGIVFHTDAVQAVGKIPVNVDSLFVNMLSVSGHKVYGPKGTGILFVRKGTPLNACLTGGHQERNVRAGTENVASAVGLAKAMTIACSGMEQEQVRLSMFRDRLEELLLQKIDDIIIHGKAAPRVPNTTSISFLSVEGESVLLHLDLRGICASAGSACTTGTTEPSHVLRAMGVTAQVAQSALRFSLGKDTNEKDIDTVAEALSDIIEKLRRVSSI